jgi:(R)-citramalate synthase
MHLVKLPVKPVFLKTSRIPVSFWIGNEDLPYIVSDVLGNNLAEERIKVRNYYICHAHKLNPVATLCIEINGELYEETSTGDGQYDAFMKALGKIYDKLNRRLPTLMDYIVTIPPGGRTNALVETVVTWKLNGEFKTRGLDSDQTASAIKATVKMLNIVENRGMI